MKKIGYSPTEMDEFAKLVNYIPPRQQYNNGILDVFAALVSSDEKIHLETAEKVSRESIDKND